MGLLRLEHIFVFPDVMIQDSVLDEPTMRVVEGEIYIYTHTY